MSAHTNGPWEIRDDDEQGCVSIIGGSQIVLARVRTATVEPGDSNARLIAAAPELLEALEGLCGLAELRPGHLQDYKAAVADARAAIAKARGTA